MRAIRGPGETKNLILKYIGKYPRARVIEMANAASVSYYVAKQHVEDLRRAGQLKNIGSRQKPHWRVEIIVVAHVDRT